VEDIIVKWFRTLVSPALLVFPFTMQSAMADIVGDDLEAWTRHEQAVT
jgi:hypothetical protein